MSEKHRNGDRRVGAAASTTIGIGDGQRTLAGRVDAGVRAFEGLRSGRPVPEQTVEEQACPGLFVGSRF